MPNDWDAELGRRMQEEHKALHQLTEPALCVGGIHDVRKRVLKRHVHGR